MKGGTSVRGNRVLARKDGPRNITLVQKTSVGLAWFHRGSTHFGLLARRGLRN